jgi:hypothetical protein
LCSPSYCQCDAQHCMANLSAGADWFDLSLANDGLAGSSVGDNYAFVKSPIGPNPITFQRVAP